MIPGMSTLTSHPEFDLESFDPNAGPIGTPASTEQLDAWIEQFHRDGYLVLHDVLPQELIPVLREDLDKALANAPDRDAKMALHHRMFESSKANLALFELEPVVSFAERLMDNDDVHVMHNNSFVTRDGGGISTWHQDNPPHYLVTHGEPPTNVRLPVLLFTANYYLTDVEDPKYGPTEVIPRSHLFGRPCPADITGTKEEKLAVSCVGKAGSVVLFNNQTWHRGGPNLSDRTRYITQISYGRRIVGHKYYPHMNYMMPEHVIADASPRKKRLLGFLARAGYG
jgi:ectoine hydroxylase-related dioxygenase (phytanoyl-CoA dioxygenase family)